MKEPHKMTLEEKFEAAGKLSPMWERVTLFSWGDLLGMRDRITALQSQLDAKWISVEERLPEDQQEVLIVVPSINLHTKAERQDVFHANFWEESKTMASCEEGDFEDGEYTHWQPLPPPPSGAKGETKP